MYAQKTPNTIASLSPTGKIISAYGPQSRQTLTLHVKTTPTGGKEIVGADLDHKKVREKGKEEVERMEINSQNSDKSRQRSSPNLGNGSPRSVKGGSLSTLKMISHNYLPTPVKGITASSFCYNPAEYYSANIPPKDSANMDERKSLDPNAEQRIDGPDWTKESRFECTDYVGQVTVDSTTTVGTAFYEFGIGASSPISTRMKYLMSAFQVVEIESYTLIFRTAAASTDAGQIFMCIVQDPQLRFPGGSADLNFIATIPGAVILPIWTNGEASMKFDKSAYVYPYGDVRFVNVGKCKIGAAVSFSGSSRVVGTVLQKVSFRCKFPATSLVPVGMSALLQPFLNGATSPSVSYPFGTQRYYNPTTPSNLPFTYLGDGNAYSRLYLPPNQYVMSFYATGTTFSTLSITYGANATQFLHNQTVTATSANSMTIFRVGHTAQNDTQWIQIYVVGGASLTNCMAIITPCANYLPPAAPPLVDIEQRLESIEQKVEILDEFNIVPISTSH